MQRAISALVSIILLFTLSTASAQFRVVMEPSPPLQYYANDHIQGTVVNRLKDAFSQSQIEADFQIYPWTRAFEIALTDKRALLSNVARTPEREDKFKWIGIIHRYEFGLVGINDLIVAENLSDAQHYTVAVQRGDIAHQYLLDNGFSLNKNLFLTTDITESWVLLNLGKVDFIVEDQTIMPVMAKKYLSGNNLVNTFISIPDLAFDAWLAANPGIDDSTISALQKALN